MKKEKQEFEVAQKIINGLTGQVGVDKEYLINNIHKLRDKKGNTAPDIVILGTQLYSILIENGLNESDIINTDRLLDKVNAFVYEEKFEQAIELLEVLDSLEEYRKYDDKGQKIYNFSNEIESKIMSDNFNIKYPFKYLLSRHSYFLIEKAKIFALENKNDKALSLIKEVLTFNPVYFDAYLLKAKIEKQSKLEKFKKTLDEMYKYIFIPQQMINYLYNLSLYFKEKENYYASICILLTILNYEDFSYIEKDLKQIVKEANKTSIKEFEIPTEDEARRFLQRENILASIPEKNIDLINLTYYNELKKEKPNESFLEYCKNILTTLTKSKDTAEIIENLAKKEK